MPGFDRIERQTGMECCRAVGGRVTINAKVDPEPIGYDKEDAYMKHFERSKRIASAILALIMVAACAVFAQAEELPLSDGNAVISIACGDNWYAAKSYADNLPVWQEIEKATGVKIDWQVTEPSQYDSVMKVRLAANVDMPDIFSMPGGMTNADLTDQGAALALDEYVEAYAPNWMAAFEAHPVMRTLSSDPEGNLVTSQIYSDGQYANLRVPIVRKDWLDKLGLPIPTTLDEYYEAMKAIVGGDPNGNGAADEIGMICNNWKDYFVFITAFGLPSRIGDFHPDADGKIVYTYTREEMRKTIEFLNKLYSEKLMDQDFVTSTRDIVESTYPKNIIGFGWQAPGVDIRWDGFVRSGGVEDVNHAQINPPVGPDGTVTFFIDAPIKYVCAVSATTKNPELVVKWLDYVRYTEQGARGTDWGIEGVSYELDESGAPHLTDWALHNPDGLDVNSAVRSLGAFGTLFTTEPKAFMESKLEAKTVENLQLLQPNARDPLMLVSATTEEQERYTSVSTDVTTYVDEMLQKFIIGSEPLDKWSEFTAKVENMGLATMIEVYQARYDRTYGAGE
jgi:putative aldouronate transport system substrate-binding protein